MDELDSSSQCFAAAIENRAREVGLAILTLDTMTLSLSQYVEAGRSYHTTQLHLDAASPKEVVILQRKTNDVGPVDLTRMLFNHHLVYLPRSSFDDTKGHLAIEAYIGEDPAAQHARVSTQYLATAAAAALFDHLKSCHGICIVRGSLKVVHEVASEHHLTLDPSVVEALELLPSPASGRDSISSTSISLYSLLNKTLTQPGSRLLRITLLQPLRNGPTLEARLEALDTLLLPQHRHIISGVQQCLSCLPKDLDKMCLSLTVKAQNSPTHPCKKIAQMIHSLILLRNVLRCLPKLAENLHEGLSSILIRTISNNLSHKGLGALQVQLDQSLNDEEPQATRAMFMNRVKQCFAVRSSVNGYLDLARQTFCRLTEQVHDLAASYQQAVPTSKMCYNNKRGFYLQVKPPPGVEDRPEANQQGSVEGVPWKLPSFLLVLDSRSPQCLCCTSHELSALNKRLEDCANDCVMLTEAVLENLREQVLSNFPLLQKVVDTIALLDLLLSFAAFIRESPHPYVRPKIDMSGGPLVILQGRHPLLEIVVEEGTFQANDTYLSETHHFHLITGPNMSGKSTYLRQVALVVLMAQMGCYVPAAFLRISPFERLFTHMAPGEGLAVGASGFMSEMSSISSILRHCGPLTLVLVDELGRGTGSAGGWQHVLLLLLLLLPAADATAISWSVAEHFICHRVPAMMTTHYQQLEHLPSRYPSCQVWHMKVEAAAQKLRFKWEKVCNSSPVQLHYGLMLASHLDLPQPLIQKAQQVVEHLEATTRSPSGGGPHPHATSSHHNTYDRVDKLLTIARKWVEGDHQVRSILMGALRDLQQQIT